MLVVGIIVCGILLGLGVRRPIVAIGARPKAKKAKVRVRVPKKVVKKVLAEAASRGQLQVAVPAASRTFDGDEGEETEDETEEEYEDDEEEEG